MPLLRTRAVKHVLRLEEDRRASKSKHPTKMNITSNAHALSGTLSYFLVWTGKNYSNTLRVDTYFLKTEKKYMVVKNIRIRVYEVLIVFSSLTT